MSILVTASMIIKMPINNAVAGLQGSFNKGGKENEHKI
jgi:hypothetical protein